MQVVIDHGLAIHVPLSAFERLAGADPRDLEAVTISRTGLRWDKLGKDLSIAGLLSGEFKVMPPTLAADP